MNFGYHESSKGTQYKDISEGIEITFPFTMQIILNCSTRSQNQLPHGKEDSMIKMKEAMHEFMK